VRAGAGGWVGDWSAGAGGRRVHFMTADLCEGESEPRPGRPFGGGAACAEPNVGVPVGPEGRLRGGFKAHKEVDRGREHVGGKVAEDREKGLGRLENVRRLAGRTGVAVLKTREDAKEIAEQIRRELDHQFPANDALRTPESDEDGRRDDGTEDHYEEGDAVVVAVAACEKLAAGGAKERQGAVDVTPRVEGGGGWESFLLQRNLRVLLVEDDDSTRHVVGALLRNCNYEGRYLPRFQSPCGVCLAVGVNV
jgi:pseudo-response regulator 7